MGYGCLLIGNLDKFSIPMSDRGGISCKKYCSSSKRVNAAAVYLSFRIDVVYLLFGRVLLRVMLIIDTALLHHLRFGINQSGETVQSLVRYADCSSCAITGSWRRILIWWLLELQSHGLCYSLQGDRTIASLHQPWTATSIVHLHQWSPRFFAHQH